MAGRLQGLREAARLGVDVLRDPCEALRPVVDRVEAGDVGEEHLRRADVRGRLLAADVLLARLERHPERRLAVAVLAHADDPAWEMTLERFFGRKEGGVGASITHGHPKALGTAHHHVCAHRSRRLQQKHGHQIGGKHGSDAKVCHA